MIEIPLQMEILMKTQGISNRKLFKQNGIHWAMVLRYKMSNAEEYREI